MQTPVSDSGRDRQGCRGFPQNDHGEDRYESAVSAIHSASFTVPCRNRRESAPASESIAPLRPGAIRPDPPHRQQASADPKDRGRRPFLLFCPLIEHRKRTHEARRPRPASRVSHCGFPFMPSARTRLRPHRIADAPAAGLAGGAPPPCRGESRRDRPTWPAGRHPGTLRSSIRAMVSRRERTVCRCTAFPAMTVSSILHVHVMFLWIPELPSKSPTTNIENIFSFFPVDSSLEQTKAKSLYGGNQGVPMARIDQTDDCGNATHRAYRIRTARV